jgi:acetoin utilization deacetylase AcuC-like enzyme
MARPRFVYLPDYYCDIGEHVFRTEKYELLYRRLVDEGLLEPSQLLRPEPATREQLELVHTAEYVDDLLNGAWTKRTRSSEMPISADIIESFVLGAGGSILASRHAINEHTGTMNLAGGFHHAFPDWAEGFCYINDVAVAARNMQEEGLAERSIVVDCDLHQGNGTAYVFRDDPDVFTFSIHQQNIYPLKRRSDCDVGLPNLCTGDEYLRKLQAHLEPALEEHRPDFGLYVAGADPYEGDLLGSLRLTMEDLRARDDLVLSAFVERDIPFAVVLAGGYAEDVKDTVQIHHGTACSLIEHCRTM